MEHRKGRKRQASPAVKWSFSPIGKRSLRHSSPASPSKARQQAERENQLQELTQMRTEVRHICPGSQGIIVSHRTHAGRLLEEWRGTE